MTGPHGVTLAADAPVATDLFVLPGGRKMPARIVRVSRPMSRAVELFRDEIIALLPRLRRFARTITRNSHDADDLVQVTVERALLKFGQWKEEARLESWMFGIMRNAWIDEVRPACAAIACSRLPRPEKTSVQARVTRTRSHCSRPWLNCRRSSAWRSVSCSSKVSLTRKRLRCSTCRLAR